MTEYNYEKMKEELKQVTEAMSKTDVIDTLLQLKEKKEWLEEKLKEQKK